MRKIKQFVACCIIHYSVNIKFRGMNNSQAKPQSSGIQDYICHVLVQPFITNPANFLCKLAGHDSSVDTETGYRLTNWIFKAGLRSSRARRRVNWYIYTVSMFRRHLLPPSSEQECTVDQFDSQENVETPASIVRVCRSVDKYQSFEITINNIIYIFQSKAPNLLNPTLQATCFGLPRSSSYVKVHCCSLEFLNYII